MDRLEEWRTYVTVASLRSFTAAAKALRQSPQKITRTVASLEKRLAIRLLHRTTRSVSLTSDGQAYLERSRRVIEELDQLESHARDKDPIIRGLLKITAPVLFGQLNVVPVVTELLATHPEINIALSLVDRIVSLAEEGVDVAIRIGVLPDSALRAKLVGYVRPVLCASAAYLDRAGRPRTIESLANHRCITFSGTTPIADRWTFPPLNPGRRDRSISVRPVLVVNTGQAAIDAALQDAGIVRLLSYQVNELVESGKLRVVLPSVEHHPIPVHLVQLPSAPSRAATAFLQLAEERLRTRLLQLRYP